MSNTPIARISIRRKEGDAYKSYSVMTAWSTKFDGLFNVTLDKGSEKYPAMGLLDAFKAVASGASIEVRINNGRSERPRYDRRDTPRDSYDAEDVPF